MLFVFNIIKLIVLKLLPMKVLQEECPRNNKEPPGMRADLDRDTMVSPTCVTATQSDFWLAPDNSPRSQSDWVPVGSSVTSSLVLCGSLTMARLPNLSATAVVL